MTLETLLQERKLLVDAKICSAANNINVTAQIELVLTEEFDTKFTFEIKDSISELHRLLCSDDLRVTLPTLDISFPAILVTANHKAESQINLSSVAGIAKRSLIEFDAGRTGIRGTASLLNGPEVLFFRYGNKVQPYRWNADGINFEIYECEEALSDRFSITHLVDFRGPDLNMKKLKRAFGYMWYLFSFMKGVDVGIGNIHSISPDGMICNALIGASPRTQYQSQSGWFDRSMFKYFPEISERFADIYFGNDYQKPLRRFLEFYKIANIKSPSRPWNSIIMAQAAIEALGFAILQKPGGYSKSKIKNLNKADFLRAIRRSIGLTDSPIENCSSLQALMVRNNWDDGEDALIKIRNDITHEGSLKLEGIEVVEASESFLWFGEMMVLALIGYKKEYFDRRIRPQWRGSLKPVPL